MHINGKTKASVLNNGFLLKTYFFISNIIYTVIIGTPFINLITPYTVTHNSIDFRKTKD